MHHAFQMLFPVEVWGFATAVQNLHDSALPFEWPAMFRNLGRYHELDMTKFDALVWQTKHGKVD